MEEIRMEQNEKYRQNILKALKLNDSYFNRSVKQAILIKKTFGADLNKTEHMKDLCHYANSDFTNCNELLSLIRFVPEEYKRVVGLVEELYEE